MSEESHSFQTKFCYRHRKEISVLGKDQNHGKYFGKLQKKGESQIAGSPSLEDTTRTAAHCQQRCHWCLPDTLLMRGTPANIGQRHRNAPDTWTGLITAHHHLCCCTSGSSWEDKMKMFHLCSPLCRNHDGYYLSGTVGSCP